MIKIEDDDIPIVAAQKIITAVRKNDPSDVTRGLSAVFYGDASAYDYVDMYSLQEIQELAEYLLVYVRAHENDSDPNGQIVFRSE